MLTISKTNIALGLLSQRFGNKNDLKNKSFTLTKKNKLDIIVSERKIGVINMLDQYIIELSNFSQTAIITTVEENDNYCKKFFDRCQYNFKLTDKKTLWAYDDDFSTYVLVDDEDLEEVLALLIVYDYCKDFKLSEDIYK